MANHYVDHYGSDAEDPDASLDIEGCIRRRMCESPRWFTVSVVASILSAAALIISFSLISNEDVKKHLENTAPMSRIGFYVACVMLPAFGMTSSVCLCYEYRTRKAAARLRAQNRLRRDRIFDEQPIIHVDAAEEAFREPTEVREVLKPQQAPPGPESRPTSFTALSETLPFRALFSTGNQCSDAKTGVV
ncbi:hypothetical protein CAPTEDRAFT_193480 [Capitella teleta]|uniref:Uncharacterized protein n=1 Tax=Capitella teleta TaxID=283909 RepID=R7TTA8_CAPTE|nr:hypothetical protein CAPTEDRAFT_193480 [Capitella teleta]|eukprot:ELT97143.1 hypothetical protein CAPTEDRAFT_193480 [Capitella teleta]